MNAFSELRKYELIRDKGLYKLRRDGVDVDLNNLFGLSDIILNPDEDQICNFAAMCYLYSLFGINVTSFTAIPAGYIASFSRDGEFYGTFYTDPYYVSRDIVLLCLEKLGLDKNNSEFLDSVKNRLNNMTVGDNSEEFYRELIFKLIDEDRSFLMNCLDQIDSSVGENEVYKDIINALLASKKRITPSEYFEQAKREGRIPTVSEFNELASKEEDFSLLGRCLAIQPKIVNKNFNVKINAALTAFQNVNDQNCRDNHHILEDIICDSEELMADLALVNSKPGPGIARVIGDVVSNKVFSSEEKELEYLEKLVAAKANYARILNDFILKSGYYVYRGRDVTQDGDILNKKDRINEIKAILREINPTKTEAEINADAIDVQNMCSTDYSADIVDYVFDGTKHGVTDVRTHIPVSLKTHEDKAELRKEYVADYLDPHYWNPRQSRHL